MGKNIAIITAGGSGKRFGSSRKKQFIEIANRPLIFWTIDNFYHYDRIDDIIITLPRDDFAKHKELIKAEFPSSKIKIVPGGKERQDSVFNALLACPPETELVFIHDGVRPFVSQEEIKRLHHTARTQLAVIPAFKVKNTIKLVSGEKVNKTLPRQNLIAALTPQVFHYKTILECHKKARKEGIFCTDDAALLEHFGYDVYWLEFSSENIKITEPFDLQIAEIILNERSNK